MPHLLMYTQIVTRPFMNPTPEPHTLHLSPYNPALPARVMWHTRHNYIDHYYIGELWRLYIDIVYMYNVKGCNISAGDVHRRV